MPKTLLLMRHAKSSHQEAGLADFDRPLNSRGIRDAPRMAEWLVEQNLTPDLLISSPAIRARMTAERVHEKLEGQSEVRYFDDLYLGSPRDYLRRLSALPVRLKRILMIGHNPGLEQLIEVLTDCFETMPTAAIAEIRIDVEDWSVVGDSNTKAELVDVYRPKEQQ